jgi:CheY-like chemotaxis protein
MTVRCVIVDDNREFLQTASELLTREGITVVSTVTTGADACRSCRELQPEVALVDIDLGGEDGFQVARQVAGPGHPGLPQVILISAYAEDDFADLIAASPAVSFLSKADLSGAAIRGILGGPGRPAA